MSSLTSNSKLNNNNTVTENSSSSTTQQNPMKQIILENLEYEKILLPSLSESIIHNPIKLNNYQKQTYLFNLINNIDTSLEQTEDIRVWVLALYTIVKMNFKPNIQYCPFLNNFIDILNNLTDLIKEYKEEGKEINTNWFIKERSLLLFLSDRGSEFDKWSVASSIRRLQSQNNQFNHIKSLKEINDLKNPLLEKFKLLPTESNNQQVENEEKFIQIPSPSPLLTGELNFLDFNLPIYNISWDKNIVQYEESIPTEAILNNWKLLYLESASDRKIEVFLAELYKPIEINRLIPWLSQNPLTLSELIGFCKYNFNLAVEYCKLSQKNNFNLNIENLITSSTSSISLPILNLILELINQNFIKFSENYLRKFILNCTQKTKEIEDLVEVEEINKFIDNLLGSDWLLEQFCGNKGSLESFRNSVGY